MKRVLLLPLILCICILAGCVDTSISNQNNIAKDDIKNQFETNIDNKIKVHYIDVGQGDCEFIELPNGQTMLIDAGNQDNGDDIINYIKNLHYKNIDYVIATHPHSDHMGGMIKVLNCFTINAMYMPNKIHTSKTFENMVDAIEANNISLHTAKSGVNIISDGNLRVDLIAPVASEYSNLNDYSAVVKIVYGETIFLFAGDAEGESENDILNSKVEIDADVLKVGHHGSKTASTKDFIERVSPSIAIISCGTDNKYGHPHTETLTTLTHNDTVIYRTDNMGTIVLEADEHKQITLDKQSIPLKENAPPYNENTQKVKHISENDITVYITESGTKYHNSECQHLFKSKIQISLREAKNDGYKPCDKCNPPK